MRDLAVPPALMAIERAAHLLTLAETSGHGEVLLRRRLAPDMFDFADQLGVTAGFALRATLPLVGRDLPDFDFAADGPGLRMRFAASRSEIEALTQSDFRHAEERTIFHRAGFSECSQNGRDYLLLFALPNLWFHLSVAFAILRGCGLPVGKGDFDGQHIYPEDFSFGDL